MNNDKLFELMTKMYSDMQTGFKGVNERIDGLDEKVENLNKRMGSLENTVLKIEQEHGNKLDALFDGYKQNSEKLDRIEKEVSKHEEFILRRVK